MKWQLAGPRIVLLSMTLLGVCMLTAATIATDANDALASAIRITARWSFAHFVVAFAASSFAELFPSSLSVWIRRNRRYFGVSFACSHLVHAAVIAALAIRTTGESVADVPPVEALVGGIGYVFIVLMLLTSTDRTARIVGPRIWSAIHTTGSYLVFAFFALAYVTRSLSETQYLPAVTMLLIALSLRIARRIRRSRTATR